MDFSSIAFAIFLPIVFIIYWALPHKFRWVLLFIASYYFYMSWNPRYVFLILLATIVSYAAARLLEKQSNKRIQKWILACALLICLGVLFFFKYFNFISDSVVSVLQLLTIQLHPTTLKILLPVGISFYTFQTLSYLIDVYKGEIQPEHNFGIYATFISFFPLLLSGPIERAKNLLPQIRNEKKFDYHQATYGLKLMTWGFYKKMVIADVIAVYVDAVYTDLYAHKGLDLAIVIFFFTIQIYCDFSGYSDIAIGTAKLLGINLMINFRNPYLSSSIKEFWGRWHISLSSWFKDYVYIPLGGNRCSKSRNYINLFFTFLLSGLWHGANWTFVVWGGIHGIGQIAEKQFDSGISKIKSKKIGYFISILLVFIFCCLAWVFFRAESLGDAIYVISNIFTGIEKPAEYLHADIGLSRKRMCIILFTIFILFLYDLFSLKEDVIEKISSKHWVIRYSCYIILLLLIMCLRSATEAKFVYFQF